MGNKVLNIEESFLKEVIDYSSRSLVGKLLKRFDILNDKIALKSESKELIYEEFRQFRDLLLAYDKGFVFTTFNFKKTNGDSGLE